MVVLLYFKTASVRIHIIHIHRNMYALSGRVKCFSKNVFQNQQEQEVKMFVRIYINIYLCVYCKGPDFKQGQKINAVSLFNASNVLEQFCYAGTF